MCYHVINLTHRISFFLPPHSSPWLCILGQEQGLVPSSALCPCEHLPQECELGWLPSLWALQEVLWGMEVMESCRLNSHRAPCASDREKCSCKVFSLSSGTQGWFWCGVWLSQARDGVVASAGALALIKDCRGYESGLNFTLLPLMLSSALKGVQTMAAQLWLFSSGLSKHNLG